MCNSKAFPYENKTKIAILVDPTQNFRLDAHMLAAPAKCLIFPPMYSYYIFRYPTKTWASCLLEPDTSSRRHAQCAGVSRRMNGIWWGLQRFGQISNRFLPPQNVIHEAARTRAKGRDAHLAGMRRETAKRCDGGSGSRSSDTSQLQQITACIRVSTRHVRSLSVSRRPEGHERAQRQTYRPSHVEPWTAGKIQAVRAIEMGWSWILNDVGRARPLFMQDCGDICDFMVRAFWAGQLGGWLMCYFAAAVAILRPCGPTIIEGRSPTRDVGRPVTDVWTALIGSEPDHSAVIHPWEILPPA